MVQTTFELNLKKPLLISDTMLFFKLGFTLCKDEQPL